MLATIHKVSKGEALESIARKYGHRDWKMLWNAPQNKALVFKRVKPEGIQPGDQLTIPPNETQVKEQAAKLAGLQLARKVNMKLRDSLENESVRIQRKVKVFDELIQDTRRSTEEIVRELEKNLIGMKSLATSVDAAATLAQMGVTLGKIGSLAQKSTKLSGEALKKVNEEAIKEAASLATDPIKDASIKAVSTLKDRAVATLAYAGMVAAAWDKMTSPSFWANAYVQIQRWQDVFAGDDRRGRSRHRATHQVGHRRGRQADPEAAGHTEHDSRATLGNPDSAEGMRRATQMERAGSDQVAVTAVTRKGSSVSDFVRAAAWR